MLLHSIHTLANFWKR